MTTIAMNGLADQIEAFQAAKCLENSQARQTAALFLVCGIDLSEALAASKLERGRTISRLQRLIERERIKGTRRHWSYDLNRHIALKQALDRLRDAEL